MNKRAATAKKEKKNPHKTRAHRRLFRLLIWWSQHHFGTPLKLPRAEPELVSQKKPQGYNYVLVRIS